VSDIKKKTQTGTQTVFFNLTLTDWQTLCKEFLLL